MASSNTQKNNFSLITGCKGYVSKPDITNTNENYLVSGSQNVLINDQEKIEARLGYTVFGAENTNRNPIKSSYRWATNIGEERFLRFANDILYYYSEDTDAWEQLLTGLDSDYPMRFAEYWNTTELTDELLFVNHSDDFYSWTGATATIAGDASVAAGTITILQTISERKFLTSGTRSIAIKDSGGTWRTTAYTAQSGSAFTVSTDLSAFTFAANAPVIQVVRTNSNSPTSGFVNDTIAVLENQAWFGSHSSRVVYISKNTDYTNFTPSNPRVPGEGTSLTLDDTTTAFEKGIVDGRETMIIFSGKDRIYRTEFNLTSGSTADRETVRVKAITDASGQGAKSQELVTRLKSAVVFVNNDNELVELDSVENKIVQTPISDPVKPDFLDADFTNGRLRLWRSSLYVSAPASSRMFIYDISKKFWHSPLILAMRELTVYGGNLYGHSASIEESYKLFDGFNDSGQPIAFKAHFAYRNGDVREKLKIFDRYFVEMYLSSNCIVKMRLIYDYLGSKSVNEYLFKGDETDYLFVPNPNASLGVNSLGTASLGATLQEPEDLLKYRRIKKVQAIEHFEYQVQFWADEIDSQFQILSHGSNLSLAKSAPAKITG